MAIVKYSKSGPKQRPSMAANRPMPQENPDRPASPVGNANTPKDAKKSKSAMRSPGKC